VVTTPGTPPSGRRIRLSARAVAKEQEAQDLRAYSERAGAGGREEFGSPAEKLRTALKPRDE
jgi:hypothetical protein